MDEINIIKYIIWLFTWPVLIIISYQLVKFAIKKWEIKQEKISTEI